MSGWVHSMTISQLSFGNTLVGIGWDGSFLLCTDGLRNSPLAFLDPDFQQ